MEQILINEIFQTKFVKWLYQQYVTNFSQMYWKRLQNKIDILVETKCNFCDLVSVINKIYSDSLPC